MTSGVRISDDRTYTDFGFGPDRNGRFYSKSWAGSDRPVGSRANDEHPYTMTAISTNNPVIHYRTTSGQTSDTITSFKFTCGEVGYLSPEWDSNDDLKLLGKLSHKIRGNNFHGDNFLAEGHQAIRLLASTANRLAGFLESVRHGNIYKAARYLGGPKLTTHRSRIARTLKRELTPDGKSTGSLSNAILEVQYGWRPLLQDAHSFGEALGEIMTKVPRETYRVQRKITVDDEANTSVTFHRRTTKSVVLKVIIECEPSNRQILHMNDALGAIWEATPWSFIADWFIPINSYLDAVNLTRQISFASVTKSTKTVQAILFKSADNYHSFSGGDGYYNKQVTLVRTLENLSTLAAVPLPAFKPLSKVLSPEHALNAFALLNSTANGFTKSLKF